MAKAKRGSTQLTTDLIITSVDLANDVTGNLPISNIDGGTSGGVLGFDSGGGAISSAALAQNQLVLGGGAGAVPATLGSLGTASTVLHGNASGAPSFGAIVIADFGAAVTALFAAASWGSAGTETANVIEITLTLKDMSGSTLAVATTEVEIIVSDSSTSAAPSSTATIAAAGTPIGTLLDGSGTATVQFRTSSSGTIAIAVTETAAASRHLWVKQGPNSQAFVRAEASPKQLTFA